jgi:hypothetical protein
VAVALIDAQRHWTTALEHDVPSPWRNTRPPVLPRSAVHSGIARSVAATRE